MTASRLLCRILLCECVSFGDVAKALEDGGVKLSRKLIGHLLDQQGVTHFAEGSSAIQAGGAGGAASASATDDDEAPRPRVRRGARGAGGGGGVGGVKAPKRCRYK